MCSPDVCCLLSTVYCLQHFPFLAFFQVYFYNSVTRRWYKLDGTPYDWATQQADVIIYKENATVNGFQMTFAVMVDRTTIIYVPVTPPPTPAPTPVPPPPPPAPQDGGSGVSVLVIAIIVIVAVVGIVAVAAIFLGNRRNHGHAGNDPQGYQHHHHHYYYSKVHPGDAAGHAPSLSATTVQQQQQQPIVVVRNSDYAGISSYNNGNSNNHMGTLFANAGVHLSSSVYSSGSSGCVYGPGSNHPSHLNHHHGLRHGIGSYGSGTAANHANSYKDTASSYSPYSVLYMRMGFPAAASLARGDATKQKPL